uniref:Uncharacterized protein n=1 Tax=Setaria viridis TaxID=4556 RepID=A0A4U6ULE4_SETVI|nr:hypothetical protein SEVIR_6G235050v2 [Setaria viridis]
MWPLGNTMSRYHLLETEPGRRRIAGDMNVLDLSRWWPLTLSASDGREAVAAESSVRSTTRNGGIFVLLPPERIYNLELYIKVLNQIRRNNGLE